MNEAERQKAIKVLEKVIKDKWGGPHSGLCSVIARNMGSRGPAIDEILAMFSDWPEYSGDYVYPVPTPSTNPDLTPGQAFDSLPLWFGEYGETRLRLAKYLLQRLETMVIEEPPVKRPWWKRVWEYYQTIGEV